MDEIIAFQADVIALKSSIQTINQGIVLDQAFRQRIQGYLDKVLTMDETMENVRHRVNVSLPFVTRISEQCLNLTFPLFFS